MSTEPFPQQPEPGAGQTPPSASVPPHGYPQYEQPFQAAPGGPAPSTSERFFGSIRRSGFYRSDDRWVGGVAGGLAERLGWDPLLVRGLLFLSFFLTGVGLVVYGVAWALLPERRDGRIHLEQAIRGDFDPALIGAGLAILVGGNRADGVGTWWFGDWGWLVGLFWLAVWVVGGWLLFRYIRDRRRQRPVPPAGAAPYATPYGPTSYGQAPHGPAGPGTAAPFAAPTTSHGTTSPTTGPVTCPCGCGETFGGSDD